jgi:outer membrane lipoprotein carrier protein
MKLNIFNFFLILTFCFPFASNVDAQLMNYAKKKEPSDPEATKILKKLKDKFTAFTAMSAEYVLTIDNRETKETQNGKLTQKGNKFYVDNNGNQIFCDGVTVWMYMKNNNTVQVNNFEQDDDPMSPSRLLKIYESDKEFYYAITNETAVKSEIEFKPHKKDVDFSKIRIEVDKTKNEVTYIKVFAKDGTIYTLDIKSIKSASPDDSIFVFNKSKFPGVKVEDLR